MASDLRRPWRHGHDRNLAHGQLRLGKVAQQGQGGAHELGGAKGASNCVEGKRAR
jgi:hypothetical protein